MDYRELGFMVLRYRKIKGLDQGQLADVSGVSRNYISMIERGQAQNVSIDILDKLAGALDISIWVLLEALVGKE